MKEKFHLNKINFNKLKFDKLKFDKLNPDKLKPHIPILLTCLKYLFSVVLTFMAFSKVGNAGYLAADLFELFLIFAFSNVLMKKDLAGRIVNDILMLFYNAQVIMMFFANSYITMVMLTNLDSLEALSGKAGIYITGTLLVLVFSFLPIQKIEFPKVSRQSLLSAALCLELVFTMFFGSTYSPIYNYFNLAIQHYESVQLNRSIEAAVREAEEKKAANDSDTEMDEFSVNTADYTAVTVSSDPSVVSPQVVQEVSLDIPGTDLSFYNEEVAGYREKDTVLSEQPNIILIFTEGLSQNVISDERNIMPNVAEYQNKSLSFASYYNHTFATFRGIIGQLYSGYQLDNYDTNALVSLQDVFSALGYNTSFINTEPNHKEFTSYLENLRFDEIIGDTSYTCNGLADSISDKDAYEILFDSAEKKAESDEPFFMAIYTFGTHASLDSTDEKFGDGKDAELNKFYNADCQFGQFMEKFENSSLADNTLIVFTADHATYRDDSFNNAFTDYPRAAAAFDEIPLFFYYKGITAESIDVNGRNTLNMAPTLLDYLDISTPNYFLGTSLFAEKESSIFETSHSDSYVLYSSKNDEIKSLEGTDLEEFNTLLQEYYITKEIAAAR